jgi:IS30 family transposase
MTNDRGSKIAFQKNFTMATNIKPNLFDSCNQLQIVTSEDSNALLRNFLAKCTDLGTASKDKLPCIQTPLNEAVERYFFRPINSQIKFAHLINQNFALPILK